MAACSTSGLAREPNLPHFPRHAGRQLDVVLLDPSAGMLERAHRKAAQLGLSMRLVDQPAQQLPFPAESFETVVFALTLCTIPDPVSALHEARRVLRPTGRLLVPEHVRAGEPGLAQ